MDVHEAPVRSTNLDHPDELRVDLDPGPGVGWADVRLVALEVQSLLEELGLRGWPKTRAARACAGELKMVEGRTPRRVP
jgi:DNA primase